ncbi:MAG: FixH family protein [Gammaproteobacteria bacterium]
MDNMVVTLVGGIVVIALLFGLVYRLTSLSGKTTAFIMAILVSFVYLTFAVIFWPGADVFAIHIAVYLVLVYILGIITSQRDVRKEIGKSGFGIHWGPASITAFFIFLIIADSLFIMVATKGINYDLAQWLLPKPQSGATVSSNFPGTVRHDYQEKEQHYNAYLNQTREQSERGWQVKKGWLGEPKVGQSSMFRVTVKDKQGNPIEKAEVTGSFMRPGNMKIDQTFTMQEKAPGDYFVALALPEHGTWNLSLKIVTPQGKHELVATTTVSNVTDNN